MTSIPSPGPEPLATHAAPRHGVASRTGTLLVVTLVLGGAVLLAGPARIAGGISWLFQAYVDAQQRMLAAAGNITADGRSEFAVLLREGAGAVDLRASMAAIEGVRFEREADLAGWAIVTVEAGDRRALDALVALPEARLVVPNRGMWVCH